MIIDARTRCSLSFICCIAVGLVGHSQGGESCDVGTDHCIVSATSNQSLISLTFSDGLVTAFHSIWLRDNALDVFHPSSGQRVRNFSAIPLDLKIQSLKLQGTTACHDAVDVTFADSDNSVSTFSAQHLYERAYDIGSLLEHQNQVRPRPFFDNHSHPVVEYATVMNTEQGLREWLQNINMHGWSLVKGVPNETAIVNRLADRIGPPSHTALYGSLFHVRSYPNPKNIAYSSEKIPLHLDLSYYESPPGIQLLHCRDFAASGGSSVLMDAHALAEKLKMTNPEAFQALTRIPATFTKMRAQSDDSQQASAAFMEYRRPHIDVNEMGEVKAVFWSPPFMGPLRVRPEDVLPYYTAVQAFEASIDEETEHSGGLAIRFRLNPGTAVTFNQRRMLHGRDAFDGTGHRHLEGTYVNIDDFQNKVHIVNSRRHGRCKNGDGTAEAKTISSRVGNGAF